MAYPIYSSFNHSLGSSEAQSNGKAQARRALDGMKRSLKSWLDVRSKMDDYVMGQRKAPALLRNPGAKPLPPATVAATLRQERYAVEQDLAQTIHSLLVQSGCDERSLPSANVSTNPDAAAQLAALAIEGCEMQGDAGQVGHQGMGAVPLLVVGIPVLGAVLVLSQLISSKAEVAKEQERIRCVESGACTDSGFWLKVASVSVIAWLAWDKLGLKNKVKL